MGGRGTAWPQSALACLAAPPIPLGRPASWGPISAALVIPRVQQSGSMRPETPSTSAPVPPPKSPSLSLAPALPVAWPWAQLTEGDGRGPSRTRGGGISGKHEKGEWKRGEDGWDTRPGVAAKREKESRPISLGRALPATGQVDLEHEKA